jgi:hypothetical protein
MSPKKKQILIVGAIWLVVLVLAAITIFNYLPKRSAAKAASTAVTILSMTPPATFTLIPTATQTLTPTPVPSPTATVATNGQLIVIGYSVENRPLEVYQFGDGSHHLMIIAGVHGGYEANTVSLADALIEKFKGHEIEVPEDVTLYILRNLNPDGYAKQLGPDGRANADNVDLNRNWDANWQANWWGTQCWSQRRITAGKKAFSEPETLATSKFILDNKIEALINYHSAGLGIFPGGWPNDKRSMQLANQLSLVSPYSYPPVDTDCEYTGQLIDWASSKGIAAVDVELRNHIDNDMAINLYVVNIFLNWQKYLTE